MPVYNAEKYLIDTLNSVIEQTFDAYELIAIDDGSTDKSLEILDSFAERDSRIKIYRQENLGVSRTRNRGIDISRGKYIGFIDADDQIEKDFLKVMYELLKIENTEIAITGYTTFYNKVKGKLHNYTKNNLIFDKKNKDEWFNQLLDNGLGISIWNKLYKKELIDKYNIRFDESLSYGEDIFFCWKVVLVAKSISFDNFSRYYYRLSSISATMKYHNNLYEKYKAGFDDIITFSKHNNIYNKKINDNIDYYLFCRLPAIFTMIIRSKKTLKEKKEIIIYIYNEKQIKNGKKIYNLKNKQKKCWYYIENTNKINNFIFKIYIYDFKNKLARIVKKYIEI